MVLMNSRDTFEGSIRDIETNTKGDILKCWLEVYVSSHKQSNVVLVYYLFSII